MNREKNILAFQQRFWVYFFVCFSFFHIFSIGTNLAKAKDFQFLYKNEVSSRFTLVSQYSSELHKDLMFAHFHEQNTSINLLPEYSLEDFNEPDENDEEHFQFLIKKELYPYYYNILFANLKVKSCKNTRDSAQLSVPPLFILFHSWKFHLI